MIIEIGIIAGNIWKFLEERGDLVLTEIYNRLDHQKDHIFLSIRWLAREGHIIIDKESEDYKIALRKTK